MNAAILAVHIGGGIIAVVSGIAAFAFRKGDGLHRVAGTIFFLSMLVMASTASYLGFVLSKPGFGVGGILVIYLVTTGWTTARRKDNEVGALEVIGLVVVVLAIAASVLGALEAMLSATPKGARTAVASNVISGVVLALLGWTDLSVIRRGGVAGVKRIARHIWRMCAASFVATGSFFLGQMQVFPPELRNTALLWVLAFLPLAMMVFWLVRVRLTNWWQTDPEPAETR